MSIGKPYERLAEDGSLTVAQGAAAIEIKGDLGPFEQTQTDMLADGYIRIYVLDRNEIIRRIVYIDAAGEVTE